MKTNLENFYDDLKREMAEEVLMPFVCNGNPLDAEVLIIGFNPTTEYDFWKFFTNKKGFDHVAELEDYIYHRALKNKKTKLSNTRGRIKRLEDILWKKWKHRKRRVSLLYWILIILKRSMMSTDILKGIKFLPILETRL